MKMLMIESDIPEVGTLKRGQLKEAVKKSKAAPQELGPGIQWNHSCVAGDNIFCGLSRQG